ETGIDLRSQTGRFRRLRFSFEAQLKLGTRSFFEVQLSDADSMDPQSHLTDGLAAPITGEANFWLRLSHEHTGFSFEQDLQRAAEAVQQHSGGRCSQAILAVAAGGS
ncbi:unnamed protein product, partial [Polarella glacialis]